MNYIMALVRLTPVDSGGLDGEILKSREPEYRENLC